MEIKDLRMLKNEPKLELVDTEETTNSKEDILNKLNIKAEIILKKLSYTKKLKKAQGSN
jgi:hypothetical protein